MAQYDAVVIGLGAMGSAALHDLARRGARVLGIERFSLGHDQGSSHGETRIIRLGYFEHPSYVPLLRRTYELWRELEAASRQKRLHITGIIEIGAPQGELVAGTLLASRTHDLPHQILDAAETMRRFPAFRIPSYYIGVFQPDGGFVLVEPAIEAMLRLATEAGAQIRAGETVRSVTPGPNGIRIETNAGTVEARTAIVTAGAWAKQLLPNLPLHATRQVFAWFKPLDDTPFADGRFPVFLLENKDGAHFYGFPPGRGSGVKIAKHHHANETVDPDRMDRTVSSNDEALIRDGLAQYIPAANGPLLAAKTCIYTMTPDHDFLIDRVPDASNVIVASPCSGHGFKFAPVIGEVLAELAIDGATRHDISRFSLARFG